MKRLLCFGDSNTYGYAPYDGRYAAAIRWSGILAERLAPDWQLIEAGLNGRTIAAFDPLWPEKNGAEILPAYLRRYAPLDLLLLMLGSNDALYAPAEDVADAMDGLLAVARREAPGCRLLLLAPPAPAGDVWRSAVVQALPPLYRVLADRYGAVFADTNLWQPPLAEDGCHLAAAGHRVFAERLFACIRQLEQTAEKPDAAEVAPWR